MIPIGLMPRFAGDPQRVRWEREKLSMVVPEYDNLAKWATFFNKMPFWLKACVVILVISVVSIWAYIQLGPIRQLQSDNAQLKNDVAAAERRADDLKDKKDELHRENLYYKNLIAPLQKKAEELYPELESATALAKLAKDIETVRSLATRDVYKPLGKTLSDALVQHLTQIRELYTNPPKLVIAVEQGNSTRMRVGSDLKSFLDRAGFITELRPQQTFRKSSPPDVSITFNPINLQLVQKLADVIGQSFINKQFSGTKNEKFGKEEIVIAINGDPLFSEEGIVTFR